MLSSPKTVACHPDAVAPIKRDRRTPVGHASPPVLISERQVMFATAAAGVASPTVVTRRPWIILLWQRLSLCSDAEGQPGRYGARPPRYLENAAIVRETERL
jgi:hypothetical protein